MLLMFLSLLLIIGIVACILWIFWAMIKVSFWFILLAFPVICFLIFLLIVI